MKSELNHSFRNVSTQEEADEIVALLSENGVPTRIKKDEGDLDYVFQGEALTNKFEIIIREEDHSQAKRIMEQAAQELLNDVDSSYYLFDFSDDELVDLLVKKDEWSEFDVLLSEKILSDRNVNIDTTKIEAQREVVRTEYKKPQGGQDAWIILGYIMAVLGGFLGLIIGYFIWQAKNKLPSGEKVFAYTKATRTHGMIIFFISVVVFPLVFFYRVIFQLSPF